MVPSQPEVSRARILVVDDEEAIRAVLAQTFAGHEVVEAADGEQALERMAEAPADVGVIDIHLRRMDGCALAAHIHERWPTMPLVAISGYVDDRDVAEFDFDGFLSKPIDPNRLRFLVDKALASRGR